MSASICFVFNEAGSAKVNPGRANEWYRMAENWEVDALIMIDETAESGRFWEERMAPQQPVQIPVHRFRTFDEMFETFNKNLVYVETPNRKPSLKCSRATNLFRYEHRLDAIYVFGGHYGAGLAGLKLEGDWIHVPCSGVCHATQIGGIVMYDRARKTKIAEEVQHQTNKRENELLNALNKVSTIQRSAVKILEKVL